MTRTSLRSNTHGRSASLSTARLCALAFLTLALSTVMAETEATLAKYTFDDGALSSSVEHSGVSVTEVSVGNKEVRTSANQQNLYYDLPSLHNEEQAIEGNYYLEFTITPEEGLAVSYSRLKLSYGGSMGTNDSTSYVASFVLRTSLDGYSEDLAAFSCVIPGNPVTPTPEVLDFDFSRSDRFRKISGPVTFRVYAYTHTFVNVPFTRIARPRIDNIVVWGSVNAHDEPR